MKTRLCELLGLDVPIILAPMGTSGSAELAAAASNEGRVGRHQISVPEITMVAQAVRAAERGVDVIKQVPAPKTLS